MTAFLSGRGLAVLAEQSRKLARRVSLGREIELPGPVGERNVYALHAKGEILIAPASETGLYLQLASVLAAGNRAVVDVSGLTGEGLKGLPPMVQERLTTTREIGAHGVRAALVEGDGARIADYTRRMAEFAGPIVPVQGASSAGLAAGTEHFVPEWLAEETSTSVNTAAAGGNASLMTLDVNP